jgi:hypothetical protein
MHCGGSVGHIFKEIDMAQDLKKRGVLRGALDALIEARSRQAERYVNGFMMILGDEALEKRGIDRQTLLKRSSSYPF